MREVFHTCGKMILVISRLPCRRSYAAAITSEETKEQSVMMVCVIEYDETSTIICAVPRTICEGRAHLPKCAFCSPLSASRPSGSSHGVLKWKGSRCPSPSHG